MTGAIQKTDDKKNVYLTQFNTPSSRNLMPLSAGLLYSYAMTQPKIQEHFNFQIEIMRAAPEATVGDWTNPALISYSLYFWNFNQSMLSAKAAKTRFPNIPILVGGPSAPLHQDDTLAFFAAHPYIDAVVAGEGEIVFADILLALADGNEIGTVAGVSYRNPNGQITFNEKRDYIKDVSILPSPFLNGTFDDLMTRYHQHMTGVVWETNRGCPFTCSFCFWGGPDSKISQFPLDRVYAELDWIAKNKIAYIFGADANFGIVKRDLDIAHYMAKLNRETGYPKFFVINWTKNSTGKIFEIVDALKDSTVKFMMTTSVQSHNPETLKAIKRQNIRLESFNTILEEASKRNFDTYSELILGLPLETYRTFLDGIRKVLSPNLHYHFNVYQCVLIPGTEMARPEYIDQYKIQSRRCIMNLGKTVHQGDAIPEYEDIVVATSSMPTQDWKKSHTFAYVTKAIYGFRPAFFVLNYLRAKHGVDIVDILESIISQAASAPHFKVIPYALKLLDELQNSILSGGGNETIKIPGVETSLHPETAVLVAVLSDKTGFYRELSECLQNFCQSHGVNLKNDPIYSDILRYQTAMIPSWAEPSESILDLNYDIHGYFSSGLELLPAPHRLTFDTPTPFSNCDDFLQKQIYGGMIFALRKASTSPLRVRSAI